MEPIQARHAAADRPVTVLQYGEGNFLRGFVDYMIDIANEKGVFAGNVAVVKAIPMGSLEAFRAQHGLYTVTLRGQADGQPVVENRVVTCIADVVDAYAQYDAYAAYARLESLRFIVSNTTEAGIVYSETDALDMCPPESYPAKLTKLLFERCEHFQHARDKGLIILPVELIDDNGARLKECVVRLARRWRLGDAFLRWLDEACVFCSTLVDRIVTGYPHGEAEALWHSWGYEDRLIVAAEPFALWVIESGRDIRGAFPLDRAGLPVLFTEDQRPYKERKVRILNGTHTAFVMASYLAGNDTVLASMEDPAVHAFIRRVLYGEILPTLSLPREAVLPFADAVLDRFRNPFVRHDLLTITLNSVSKWRARCLPSLTGYLRQNGRAPSYLAFSLAALVQFYHGNTIEDGALLGHRGTEPYRIIDEREVLDFFLAHASDAPADRARAVLSNEAFWGQDLTAYDGLEAAVIASLADIEALGMRGAIENLLGSGKDGAT